MNSTLNTLDTVAAFYADWSTQDYTEVQTSFNGCYARTEIDGITYLDCELYGHLNSRDNAVDVANIIADRFTI